MAKLSHISSDGSSRMVNVGGKRPTARKAVARGRVVMKKATADLIRDGKVEKGNVFEVARVAAIMAAKRTPELIPMCHAVQLTGIDVQFAMPEANAVEITATTSAVDRTGVEMEALAAVSAAALTIYDMCKAVDRGMTITEICLVTKSGGRSGAYRRRKGGA